MTTPRQNALVYTNNDAPDVAAYLGDIVHRWHDDTDMSAHGGTFAMCQAQPCYAIREAIANLPWENTDDSHLY